MGSQQPPDGGDAEAARAFFAVVDAQLEAVAAGSRAAAAAVAADLAAMQGGLDGDALPAVEAAVRQVLSRLQADDILNQQVAALRRALEGAARIAAGAPDAPAGHAALLAEMRAGYVTVAQHGADGAAACGEELPGMEFF